MICAKIFFFCCAKIPVKRGGNPTGGPDLPYLPRHEFRPSKKNTHLVYLENPRYSAGFLGFASDFAPALRLTGRETRELPEWSTKNTRNHDSHSDLGSAACQPSAEGGRSRSRRHPLVSLEISGNAKCWGRSFLETWMQACTTCTCTCTCHMCMHMCMQRLRVACHVIPSLSSFFLCFPTTVPS